MSTLRVETLGDPTSGAAVGLTLRQLLQREPYTLAMSSGFFSFYAHSGVLAALEDERLTPRRLAGSSAGGLVAGLWAAGLEAHQLRQQLSQLQRQDFWDPAPGLGLLRGRRFRQLLERLLPVTTFAECRAPLTVSAFDLLRRRTAPISHGSLAGALHATCALPLMFQPVALAGRWYIDGGVADRAGLAGLATGERILHHHIVSRSPWRRPNSPALRAPRRTGMVSLEIDGLQRVNPFALARGMRAFDQARRATLAALDRPLLSSFSIDDQH